MELSLLWMASKQNGMEMSLVLDKLSVEMNFEVENSN